MATLDQLLNVARAQIGTTENPAGSNRVRMPDGTDLWGWYDKRLQGSAWCGAFVSFVFNKVGMGKQVRFAYCPAGRQQFLSNKRLFAAPQPGDVAFYEWEHDTLVDHTGIVEEVHNNYIVAIEGNTQSSVRGDQSNGGGVYRRVRPLSLCSGFGRPSFDAAPSIPAPAPAPTPTPPPAPQPSNSGDDELTSDEHAWLEQVRLLAQGAFDKATIAQDHAAHARWASEVTLPAELTKIEAQLAAILAKFDAPKDTTPPSTPVV